MKTYYYTLLLLIIPFLASCFEDKGNYKYTESAYLTIENIPERIEVLGNAENITINPVITSSVEGVIGADNPNFEYSYAIAFTTGQSFGEESDGRWLELGSPDDMNLDVPATFKANNYYGWFKVKDIRTGLETSKAFDLKVSSTIYEGWMVLCDEGDGNRVRMDMIAAISADRVIQAHDLLGILGLPEIHGANKIGFYPNLWSNTIDRIYVLSDEGTYLLAPDTFETDESNDIRNVEFILDPGDIQLAAYTPLYYQGSMDGIAVFCVSKAGDVYVLIEGMAGSAFELPINTQTRGGTPEYRVAPYVGVSKAKPGNGYSAVFYDMDNRRFVGWSEGTNQDAMQTLTPLADPTDGKLFSFNTGMELVYMESTRFSNGLVYSILQDNQGKRHIYGINMAGAGFIQESFYPDVQATDFGNAEHFAFHSQFPYMFYSVGNKVYLHNLGTGVTYPLSTISLGANEKVTLLKFNLYDQPVLTHLNDQSEEFMARQFELMVGSYDSGVADGNGGRLGFYPVNGGSNSVSKRAEYSGFAKIKDVVYRERR